MGTSYNPSPIVEHKPSIGKAYIYSLRFDAVKLPQKLNTMGVYGCSMKKVVNIPKDDGRVYFGRDVTEDYAGDADAFIDAACIVVRKPGASFEELLKSIDILKRDIKLRMEMGEK